MGQAQPGQKSGMTWPISAPQDWNNQFENRVKLPIKEQHWSWKKIYLERSGHFHFLQEFQHLPSIKLFGQSSTKESIWNRLHQKSVIFTAVQSSRNNMEQILCEEPIICTMETRLIKLAIFNLLANSYEAVKENQSEEQPSTISITTGTDHSWNWVQITDNGNGLRDHNGNLLPTDAISQIFEYGYTTKKRKTGRLDQLVKTMSQNFTMLHQGWAVQKGHKDLQLLLYWWLCNFWWRDLSFFNSFWLVQCDSSYPLSTITNTVFQKTAKHPSSCPYAHWNGHKASDTSADPHFP